MKDFFTGQQLTSVGRLSRRSYIIANLRIFGWSFLVFLIIGVFGFVSQLLGIKAPSIVIGLLYPIVSIYFAVVGVFLAIRRLHDLGMSGWLYLLMFIPLVNLIFGLYILFAKGDAGDSVYGSDPRVIILSDGSVIQEKSDTTLIIVLITLFVSAIGIIILLAVSATSVYTSQIARARDTTRISDLYSIKSGIEQYQMDNGSYPITLDESVQKYLAQMPKDPKEGQQNNRCTYGYKYEPVKSSTGAVCGYHLSACMEEVGNAQKGDMTENSLCQ